MKNKFSNQDKEILQIFLKNKIPDYIKNENFNSVDLMEYYEELFNYTHSVLKGHKVDLSVNSFGTGNSIIFNQHYKDILLKLSNSDNLDLKIHCYLCLSTLSVLERYSINR